MKYVTKRVIVTGGVSLGIVNLNRKQKGKNQLSGLGKVSDQHGTRGVDVPAT